MALCIGLLSLFLLLSRDCFIEHSLIFDHGSGSLISRRISVSVNWSKPLSLLYSSTKKQSDNQWIAAKSSSEFEDGGHFETSKATGTNGWLLSQSLERRCVISLMGISGSGLHSFYFSSVKDYANANAVDLAAANSFTTPVDMKNKILQLKDGATMKEITDSQTSLSGILYTPKVAQSSTMGVEKFPLLVVLHGAGINDIPTAWNVADPLGEHAGLPPSLLASNKAPGTLQDNFFVAAPYSYGKSSLYEEPRSKVIQFIKYILDSNPLIDRERLYLLGFSDGATLAVELLTTGYFKAGVIAAYGFTGTLPPLALQRLTGIPIWVFHSKDDVIYSVSYSDRLVKALKDANKMSDTGASHRDVDNQKAIIRYTRYEQDPEGFVGAVQGHSTGIAASKLADVYEWLLSV